MSDSSRENPSGRPFRNPLLPPSGGALGAPRGPSTLKCDKLDRHQQEVYAACGSSNKAAAQRPLFRVLGKAWGPASCWSCSCSFMGASWALLVLLLLQQQQRCVTAIVCEIDARDGLEAATASVAAAASDRQQLLHMLPLCRVPYLVNSQLPPKDVPHVGMEKGGTVTIDLQLLPSDYKNNMPAREPRFPRVSRGLPVAEESASASEYAKYKRQQQRQQQPHFRQVEERYGTSSNSSGSSSSGREAEKLPTGMLLHSDVTEGPLAALSATFPLLAHAGRRLSEIFMHQQQQQRQPQQQQQQQEQQPWLARILATAARVAGDGFELVLSNLVGINHRSPRLLLSSLSPRLPSSPSADVAPASSAAHPARSLHPADAAPAAAAAEVVEDVAVPPLARMARRRDCGRQVHRRTVGCPEWEAPPASPVRQLSKAHEDELLEDGLVHSVNNTSLLLLDHAQLYFLETHESWLPSFTAEDGLVLNSYMPAMLGVRLRSAAAHQVEGAQLDCLTPHAEAAGRLSAPVFSVFFKVTFLGPIYEQLLSWDEWIYVLFENGTDFVVIAAATLKQQIDACCSQPSVLPSAVLGFLPSQELQGLVATESTDAPAEQQQRELVWDD
ncbi:hypothetical protein Emag_000899 [Eimeria magna]